MKNIIVEALIRGAVWALIGVIYGFLLVVMLRGLPADLFPYTGYPITVVTAGALGALLYGSMRLTVMVSIYAAIAVSIEFVVYPDTPTLMMLVLTGAAIGFVVGLIYGRYVLSSRVYRADAKILAGSFAGAVASLSALIPAVLFEPLPDFLLAMILCPLTGMLYMAVLPWFIHRFSDLLPPIADGALVGTGAGGLMGLLFSIMIGTLHGTLNPADEQLVAEILVAWPMASLGGALGAFLIGAGRTFLQVPWRDY
jgi:hypothetical protein